MTHWCIMCETRCVNLPLSFQTVASGQQRAALSRSPQDMRVKGFFDHNTKKYWIFLNNSEILAQQANAILIWGRVGEILLSVSGICSFVYLHEHSEWVSSFCSCGPNGQEKKWKQSQKQKYGSKIELSKNLSKHHVLSCLWGESKPTNTVSSQVWSQYSICVV